MGTLSYDFIYVQLKGNSSRNRLTCHIMTLVQCYILWPMFNAALKWSVPITQITASRMIHPSSNNEQPLHHLLLFIVPWGFSEYSCLDKKIKEKNIKLGWKKILIKLNLLLVSSFSVPFKVIINRARLIVSKHLYENHYWWSNTSEWLLKSMTRWGPKNVGWIRAKSSPGARDITGQILKTLSIYLDFPEVSKKSASVRELSKTWVIP